MQLSQNTEEFALFGPNLHCSRSVCWVHIDLVTCSSRNSTSRGTQQRSRQDTFPKAEFLLLMHSQNQQMNVCGQWLSSMHTLKHITCHVVIFFFYFWWCWGQCPNQTYSYRILKFVSKDKVHRWQTTKQGQSKLMCNLFSFVTFCLFTCTATIMLSLDRLTGLLSLSESTSFHSG